jgi:hypothetical protein
MINERNTFLKRSTPRSPPNMNENTSSNIHSPLKISSQMVLSNDFSQTTNPKNRYNEFYENSKTEANKNNYYSEDRFSQSFDVEAERRHQQRQRDYENPQNTDPDTDYYYKQSKTSSDVNDYNNRYTYNYRRDFDYIDFNKMYPENQFGKNNTLNRNNTSKPNIHFNKPFQGSPLPSRGRSYDARYRKKGSDMEPFYKFKNIEYYGQRDPITFGYDEVDDKYRHYSPYRNDYAGSRFGSYTYNYYLNAPMRGDISEDFKYPPQYYYKPKLEGPKPGKVFTNLI